MFKKMVALLLASIIAPKAYSCDFDLLDRNASRCFSAIWNNRASEINEAELKKSLSFLYSKDKANFESLSSRKVFMYNKEYESSLKQISVPSGSFPEKAFVHPYYQDLEQLKTVPLFFKLCEKIVEGDSVTESQKIGIRLLSSEVARQLFNHFHSLMEMQDILSPHKKESSAKNFPEEDIVVTRQKRQAVPKIPFRGNRCGTNKASNLSYRQYTIL